MTSGTLADREPHPAALSARDWLAKKPDLGATLEALASCALAGNRTAQVCAGTLRRLLNGEPVSDRYLLGLAWTLREMQDLSAKETIP